MCVRKLRSVVRPAAFHSDGALHLHHLSLVSTGVPSLWHSAISPRPEEAVCLILLSEDEVNWQFALKEHLRAPDVLRFGNERLFGGPASLSAEQMSVLSLQTASR